MTTTTLRPNGTVTAGGTDTNATLFHHEVLSDNTDTTYILDGPGSGDTAIVNMTSVSLPAGSIVKQIRARMRAQLFGLRADAVLDMSPFQCVVTSPDLTATTNFIEYIGAWLPAGGLGQSGIDNATMSAQTPPGPGSWISEVYADLVYVAIPVTVVAAVTPDPVTSTNIVPIAWTNTLDADGGVQTRYQIRTFTAAQYGIGGFNPATSPATQDTGEVVGAALTRNTLALANSTTYRAYVRVAQTVNGVSHWSAYAFDQFALSFTPSSILSVTTVAVNASARIDVTVNRNTGTSAWNFVEVERSTDAGVTWSPVRGATYVAPSAADTFTVSDYETANGQSTLYRARATRIVSSLPISGAFVQSTPAVSWTSTSAWLKSPANPTRNSPVDIDTPFVSTALPVRAGVFDIIGSAERVVISDVMSSPGSTLVIRTEPSDTTLIALLRDLVLLYHPTVCEGGTTGRYISITGVTFTPTVINGHVYQLWTVPYVEIATPRDPLASAP